MRGGRSILLNVYDLLVGDILLVESGDILPVDAILTEGQSVRCDESSITGESASVKIVPADIALERYSPITDQHDPFILSGSKVLVGVGKSVVTAVGPNSCFGRMMLCKFRTDRHQLTV